MSASSMASIGDVAGALFDDALFGLAEKDSAFEPITLGHDACNCRTGFFAAVFVVRSDEEDVLTLASQIPLVDDLSAAWA